MKILWTVVIIVGGLVVLGMLWVGRSLKLRFFQPRMQMQNIRQQLRSENTGR